MRVIVSYASAGSDMPTRSIRQPCGMIKPNFIVIVPYFRFLLSVLSCPFYTINLFQESNKLHFIQEPFVRTSLHKSIPWGRPCLIASVDKSTFEDVITAKKKYVGVIFLFLRT